MNKLRGLAPEQSLEQLCALFGKTRQAYYQRLSYNYQEYAEDGIILDVDDLVILLSCMSMICRVSFIFSIWEVGSFEEV